MSRTVRPAPSCAAPMAARSRLIALSVASKMGWLSLKNLLYAFETSPPKRGASSFAPLQRMRRIMAPNASGWARMMRQVLAECPSAS